MEICKYELKGVPVRIAMDFRDIENNVAGGPAVIPGKTNMSVSTGLKIHVFELLDDIQQNMFQPGAGIQDEHITEANNWDEFVKLLDEKTGFIAAHWDGTRNRRKIKEMTKATIRCIPLDNKEEAGSCILSGKPSTQRVLFARAYQRPCFYLSIQISSADWTAPVALPVPFHVS